MSTDRYVWIAAGMRNDKTMKGRRLMQDIGEECHGPYRDPTAQELLLMGTEYQATLTGGVADYHFFFETAEDARWFSEGGYKEWGADGHPQMICKECKAEVN
jgi:hypothetical protein